MKDKTREQLIEESEQLSSRVVELEFAEIESKNVAEALHECEDKFRILVDNAPDIIMMLDRDGTITFINHVVKGLSVDDVIGKNVNEYIPPEHIETAMNAIETVFRDNEVKSYEVKGLGPDGKIAHYSTRIGPIERDGEVVAAIQITTDITDRKLEAEAVKERIKELQALYGLSKIVEREGITLDELLQETARTVPSSWRYPEIAYARITLGESEFCSENFAASDWKQSANIQVNGAIVGKIEVGYLEKRPELEEGPFFPQERALIDALAERLGHIIGRKRAEEEREQLLKTLETKAKELEQIVYVFSHDLRSPLVNVQGFSKELEYSIEDLKTLMQDESVPEEIKDKFASITEDDIVSSIRYIHTSVAKMDRLLNGLLKISRLGRDAIEIKRIDMNRMMKDVLGDFEFQAKKIGVELGISDLPPCRGDVIQISLVCSNIIGNALKYLDPERAGIIKISGYAEGSRSVYCIEDNGIGIAPEHFKDIFALFHQLDPDKSEGDGLGLTIVKRILDRANGKIWLESEIGKGSKFFVELPGK